MIEWTGITTAIFPTIYLICGGTHIGIYLSWIINNDLHGELHREDSVEAVEKLKSREITGRDFLINECDEKFWAEDLNEEGEAFTDYYYDEFYYEDYEKTLGTDLPNLYYVENSWENYDKIAPVLDKRFNEWKSLQN